MTNPENLSTMRPVTNLSAVDAVLDEAVRAADAAARAAAVEIREIADLEGLAQIVELYATIWGRTAAPPLSLELLRAFSKAGNYVGGAFDGDRLVGAAVGFFHAPAEDALHSHIAGVAGGLGGRHVGFALKLHQRAWTMLRGVTEIAWTFDPLVSRNAYFNLVKLSARPTEYLPNFYGQMEDALNGDDDSDRLLVRWRLRDPAVAAATAGRTIAASATEELARGAAVALGIGPDGEPVAGRYRSLAEGAALVAVPPDIETMRVGDAGLARDWRIAVRETLTALLADDGEIAGFDRAGWYLVRRQQ